MAKFEPCVVSGMRPTGPLHLGHYFGAIKNWVEMQNSGEFRQTYFFSADWHALTTGFKDTEHLVKYRREMVADWIAAGVDPARSVIFAQAAVPEHAELSTILQMLTPIPWLERIPSYKEMRSELADRDLSSVGFLAYPVLQTADIAIHLGTHVPVGEDQLAHVELSRQVVRRFNSTYTELLPEPRGHITETPRLAGLDGRKMSKSYNNAIYLSDSAEEVKKKVMPAPTDPARVKRTDPGTPEICNIYHYHALVQPLPVLEEVAEGCRTAGIGCVDCKRMLLARLESFQAPLRERREAALASGEVDDVLATGNQQAREGAQATMVKVREAVGL